MFTMSEADTGSNSTTTTVKIDLSNYALSSETATKVDLEALQTIVAKKLEREQMHSHSIAEVDHLQIELNCKYDISKQYSYAAILSDSEKIPYLEDIKVKQLDITTDNTSSDYIFKVDSSSGDLLIYNNSVCILSYNKALGHWIFGSTDLNEFMTEVNDTLVNHCEALKILISNLEGSTTKNN